jgi:hypothetical protein
MSEEPIKEDTPFPDLLPGAFGEMKRAMVKQFMCGVNLPSMAVLGALNAAIGNRFVAWNPVIHKMTPGNLYLVAIAKSGDGKSQVMNCAFQPIKEREDQEIARWKAEVYPKAKARKDLIEMEISSIKSDYKAKVKEARRVEDDASSADQGPNLASDGVLTIANHDALLGRPGLTDEEKGVFTDRLANLQRELLEVEILLKQPRLVVDDCTPEKMAGLLANTPYLTSASPEARKAIDVLLGRYSKDKDQPADDVFVKAYSGDAIKIDRQTTGSIDIPNPCLTVLWMVQPGMVDRLLSTAALKDSGFLQRCLFGQSEGVSGNFEDSIKIPQSVSDAYRAAIQAIFSHDSSQPQTIMFSPAAGRAVNMVREQRRMDWAKDNDDRQMFEARYSEQVARLALNLHIARYPESPTKREIELETVLAAIEIMDYFIQKHRAVFLAFEHAEALWIRDQVKQLLRAHPNGFTAREARACPLGKVRGGLEAFLDREVEAGLLFEIKGGRTTRYTDDRSKAIMPGDDPGNPF